ncbi:MAG: DUF1819 family protein [Anaerolineae bacterium]|nr:DUF1819 family protein [Anaerolineae bacterium]
MTRESDKTMWRASGTYLPTNASKAGLLEETRQFLLVYAETQDVDAAAEQLKDGGLPQRSRETRGVIVHRIKRRLTLWQPPAWVLSDLAAHAAEPTLEALRVALLLHVCRQDALLYDVVQQVIVPRWRAGEIEILATDVQKLLDQAEPVHREIAGWSHETRTKLAGNVLSILRDYGLLQGAARSPHRRIIEPVVPPAVVKHLVRLLLAEGVTPGELPFHPDWHLWLWEPDRVKATLDTLAGKELWTS